MQGGFTAPALVVALVGLLLWAGIEDVRRREIANRKTLAIALLAPLWWWANGLHPWPEIAMQIALAIGVFALFAAAFHFGWMGGGDVKLIAALGLWLPGGSLVRMLFAMAIAGGAITLAMLVEHRWHRRESVPEIPYGVAIAIAAMLAVREPILNQFT